jgi:hypothetical protein
MIFAKAKDQTINFLFSAVGFIRKLHSDGLEDLEQNHQ